MDPLKQFKLECEKICGKYSDRLETSKYADLALPCFAISREPAEEAKKLAASFSKKMPKHSLIKSIRVSGPYVNFFIDDKKFSKNVLKEILISKKYGSGEEKPEKIVLEHTSNNPSGPVHVGRLRNSIIGDTLKRILMFHGYNVETHYFVNDIGKQIAIILWGSEKKLKVNKDVTDQFRKYSQKNDFKTFFQYVAANRSINEKNMKEVEDIIRKAESGDRKSLNGLKHVARQCLEGQKKTLKKLGIDFDFFNFESKYIENDDTKRILEKLKPHLKKEDGALGIDLSVHGLRTFAVLTRKDGTSVYTLRDIPYHLEKLKRGDIIINVLGEDHRIEFQELSVILKKYFNVEKPMKAVHYSFVNFKGMRLSTRLGQTAPVDMLIDEGMEKALDEIKKRAGNRKNAMDIVNAAIRYHIVKTDLNKSITFIWDDALAFEGDTGPYLQYTYARTCSILKKSRLKPEPGVMKEEKELILIRKLSRFPEIVEKCTRELKPHHLANYLSGLAATFNEFYHSTRVIGSDREKERLALVMAVRTVLKNGLNMLGIKAMSEM